MYVSHLSLLASECSAQKPITPKSLSIPGTGPMKFRIPGPSPPMPTHLQSSKTQANVSLPLLKTCPTFLNKACPLPRPRSSPWAPQGQEPHLTQAVSNPRGRPQTTRAQTHGQWPSPASPRGLPTTGIPKGGKEKTTLLTHTRYRTRARPAPWSRPAARAPTCSGCAE